METESDSISEYKSSLNDLSFNSKPLINMLTMLAEDYKDSKAPEIVKCIEQRLNTVSHDKKLPILYLLDSICKNVGNIYIKLFTQNIVSTFCDVFEKVDEKTRLSLYKLRQTWSSIFGVKKLYAIDLRIHQKLDPAWPITAPKPWPITSPKPWPITQPKPDLKHDQNIEHKTPLNAKPILQSVVKPNANKPQTHQQQVHINPKFFKPDAKVSALALQPVSGPEAEIAKQLIQKQNELLQLQKQKLELEMINEKRKLAEQTRALQEKELKLKEREHEMFRSNSPNNGKKIKKRKRSRSHRSPSPLSQKSQRSPTHRWSQSPTDRIRENTSGVVNRQQSPSYGMRQTNSYSPHRPRSKSPNIKNQFIGQQNVVPMPNIQTSNILHSSGLLPTPVSGIVPPVPTTIPAPTILAKPEMLSISNVNIAQNVVSTMSSMRPISSGRTQMSHNVRHGPNLISNPINNPINKNNSSFEGWGQDRDYRREFDSMMSETHEKLRSGAISSADHDVLVREMERQMRDSQNNFMSNDSVMIAEPMDTFTMLVDGKLRKLFYLDDTTAVVLLNAPQNAKFNEIIQRDPQLLDPRKIGFEGKPTKVFIDVDRGSNEFVFLEFNGQQKTFFHGENRVPQRIKFGGPAKEIILNGQPYAAKFGGPPINVWFDGDSNEAHSLQLDGPTPRVKLSDERRFDLWDNIIRKAKSQIKPVSNANNSLAIPQKPVNDVNSLLSKLIAAGVISSETSQTQQNEEKIEAKKDEKSLPTDPPLHLTSDSLKLSRPSIIAALYNGIQCTNCSLRFDDKDHPFLGDKTRYSKHLDWHFRQNRRDKAKPNSSATSMRRNWYYPLNLWCQFKEVTDEEDSTNLFLTEDNECDVEEELPLATVMAEKDESLNCCAVCAEKFEQIWHEEEEEWRLKNAVKHNSKIYHPLCLTDFIAQNERLDHFNNDRDINESVENVPSLENKPNIIEESIKTELKQNTINSETNKLQTEKCDNISTQYLSDNVVNENTIKTEENNNNIEMSEINDILLSDDKKEDNPNEEQQLISEDAKIEVIEYEISLNDKEVKHNLSDILQSEKVVTPVKKEEQLESEVKEVEPLVVANDKVVLQQGGIVIKMKASNLTQQTPLQPIADHETSQTKEPEVIVKGHELSSLCSIM